MSAGVARHRLQSLFRIRSPGEDDHDRQSHRAAPSRDRRVGLVTSLLLGSVAARADQHEEPSLKQPAQELSQADQDRPAKSSPSKIADTAAGKEPAKVGSAESNVDEDSSSGSYHPYSAGTVGDDPADPTTTSVPPASGDTGPTDQRGDAADSDGDGYLWQAELDRAPPARSASFDAMDVKGDVNLTRGEFRTWHESRKARMDENPGAARSTTDDEAPNSPTPPGDTGD